MHEIRGENEKKTREVEVEKNVHVEYFLGLQIFPDIFFIGYAIELQDLFYQ